MARGPAKDAPVAPDRDATASTLRTSRLMLWVNVVVAASQIAFVALTWLTLREVQKTNELTHRTQVLTLRPYLVPDNDLNSIIFDQPAQPQESWLVTTGVGNRGSVPAHDVKVHAWVDDRGDNFAMPLPAAVDSTVVPANGAAVTSTEITKVDAVSKMQRAGCFLHLNAYYHGDDGSRYKVLATYVLSYLEGKRAAWVLVKFHAD